MTCTPTVLAVLAAAVPHPVGDFEDLYRFSLSAGKSLMSTSASNNLGTAGGFDAINSGVSAVSPVPEPNTVALMLGGFAGTGFLLRRRNQEGQ